MKIILYFRDSGDWHTLGTYSVHEVQEVISIIKTLGVLKNDLNYSVMAEAYSADEKGVVLDLDLRYE